MSMSDGSHPIWDQEVDGLPTQRRAAASPCPASGLALESKGVGHVDWMRPIRAADPYSFSIGVLAPIFCLVLDPVIFRGGDEHGPILGQYWVFFYSFIGLEILTLTLWLSGHEASLAVAAASWSGVLWAGSLISLGNWYSHPPADPGRPILYHRHPWIYPLACGLYLSTKWQTCSKVRTIQVEPEACRGEFGSRHLDRDRPPVSVQYGVDRAWREAVSDIADGDASAIQRAKFWFPFVDPAAGRRPPVGASD